MTLWEGFQATWSLYRTSETRIWRDLRDLMTHSDECAYDIQSDDDCDGYVSTSSYVRMPLTVQRANFVFRTKRSTDKSRVATCVSAHWSYIKGGWRLDSLGQNGLAGALSGAVQDLQPLRGARRQEGGGRGWRPKGLLQSVHEGAPGPRSRWSAGHGEISGMPSNTKCHKAPDGIRS